MNFQPTNPGNLNRRILLVDDNRAIHDDFRKILDQTRDSTAALDAAEAALLGTPASVVAPTNFVLDSAYQGQEAVGRVRTAVAEGRPYAMAFIDVRMPPGWDGIETTAKIWEIYPDIQIVICTAYSDYAWDDIIARIGQSDRLVILKKPFDNIEVLQLANAFVAKWQLLEEVRARVSELEDRVRERTLALEEANTTLKAEISDRNQMEVQLRHAQKMESIGQLAAGIAHEINTPTQYIGDNTRFLQDAFGDLCRLTSKYEKLLNAARCRAITPQLIAEVESAVVTADLNYLEKEIPKAIHQSLDGIERVTKIVRSMKDYSHPGTKEKVALDLNRSIESTLTVCRSEWKYVANVIMDFDATLPLVPCLPGEFNQVVLNLVINATHAIADVVGDGAKAKGEITVSTRADGHWVEVRISDTGTGIPEHVRQRIFDPFFTTKGAGKGTGQGLAIAHAVVCSMHSGTLHFETEMGRGTTFVIRLPLQPALEQEEAA